MRKTLRLLSIIVALLCLNVYFVYSQEGLSARGVTIKISSGDQVGISGTNDNIITTNGSALEIAGTLTVTGQITNNANISINETGIINITEDLLNQNTGQIELDGEIS